MCLWVHVEGEFKKKKGSPPGLLSQLVLVVKNLSANVGDARDVGSIPGLRRSLEEGNGNPLQYSCLENSMDRGAGQATVHGVVKSRTLSRVKQITSPGWMHETSAGTWCSGKTWREWVEREVGGGIGMRKTCKLKDVSFQCMTKFTTN